MGLAIAFIFFVLLLMIFVWCLLKSAKMSDEKMELLYKEHQKQADEVIEKLLKKKENKS